MDLKKINEQLKPKPPRQYNPSRRYGVMGLNLGCDLHDRLKNYAVKNNVSMSQIIKLLVKSYLDEMEGDDD
tara:strand:+ start:108 stop:320 length:213 start_codon:yes stop_codon:yes gene_type:complete